MVQLPPTDVTSVPTAPEEGEGSRRPPYRPPLGFPDKKKREIGGKIAAILLHLLLILLVLAPIADPELTKQILGAGGAGPAGGGGGGHKGSGGGVPKTERTQFVQVAPPPPPPKPSLTPQIKPPEVKPIVPPPPIPPNQEQKSEVKIDKPPVEVAGPIPGTGGGTGNDGTNGTGPGSGGGKGSGVGTGTGTSNGPGTGGGPGTIYPPVPTVIFMPPLPTPSKVRGFELIAEFDVDSTGKVTDMKFNHSKDGGYNKKLEEILSNVKFRPGVNGLGIPVRAKFQIVFTF